MGHPIDLFIDQQINQEFLCAICHDVLRDVTMIDPCEHVFCKDCINQWYPNSRSCPVDREAIRGFKTVQRVFINVLNSLQLHCPFQADGCVAVFRLGELDYHDARCDFNPENHKDCEGGCGCIVKKCEIRNHSCVAYLTKKLQEVKQELKKYKDMYGELPEEVEQDSPTSPSPLTIRSSESESDEDGTDRESVDVAQTRVQAPDPQQGPSSGSGSSRSALKRTLPLPADNDDTDSDDQDQEMITSIFEILQNEYPHNLRSNRPTQTSRTGTTTISTPEEPCIETPYGHRGRRAGPTDELFRGLNFSSLEEMETNSTWEARHRGRYRARRSPSLNVSEIEWAHRFRPIVTRTRNPEPAVMPVSRPMPVAVSNLPSMEELACRYGHAESIRAPGALVRTRGSERSQSRPAPAPAPTAPASAAAPVGVQTLNVSYTNRRNMPQEICDQVMKFVTDEVGVRYPQSPREKEELRRKILAKMEREFEPGPSGPNISLFRILNNDDTDSEAELYWSVQVHDMYELVQEVPPLHYSRLDISVNELRVVIWC